MQLASGQAVLLCVCIVQLMGFCEVVTVVLLKLPTNLPSKWGDFFHVTFIVFALFY